LDAFAVKTFTLDSLPNYTDFTNLYDEYRIKAVKVYFVPKQNSNTQGASAAYSEVPTLVSAIDYDDATAPTTVAKMMEYDTTRIHGCADKSYTRIFKPNVSLAAYSGAFTSYAQREDQWLDSDSAGVKHYGLKYALLNAYAGGNNVWSCNVYATLYIEFRKAV